MTGEQDLVMLAADAVARSQGNDREKAEAILAVVVPAVVARCIQRLEGEMAALDTRRHPYHGKGLGAAIASLRSLDIDVVS